LIFLLLWDIDLKLCTLLGFGTYLFGCVFVFDSLARHNFKDSHTKRSKDAKIHMPRCTCQRYTCQDAHAKDTHAKDAHAKMHMPKMHMPRYKDAKMHTQKDPKIQRYKD
jgi:hypothetical protein